MHLHEEYRGESNYIFQSDVIDEIELNYAYTYILDVIIQQLFSAHLSRRI